MAPRKVGKSIQFPFLVSASCWIDLLGYGGQISSANFNPLDSRAETAVRRLRQFHSIVAAHSNRYFRSLVLNDGAAVHRDLSLSSRSVTHNFLERAWKLHQEIIQEETQNGFPGARAVLAAGFRMRGRRGGVDTTNPQFRSVLERFRSGKLRPEQALHEAGGNPSFIRRCSTSSSQFCFHQSICCGTDRKQRWSARAKFLR